MTPNFPLWLKQEMSRQELSVMDLARRLDVNHGTVSMWLSGARKPKATSARRLALALGVDEDAVFVAAGLKTPDPFFDPDSRTARLIALVEQVDWDAGLGRYEGVEAQLRQYIEVDRKAREQEPSS